MQARISHYITPEEYLEAEEISPIKHEYYDGQVYAMAGGTNAHAVICTNASGLLFSQLRGQTCRVVGSEQRVKIEATGLHVYPDASVYCENARFEGAGDTNLLDPTAIIEVLSRSTAAYDRSDKFDHYKRIETLRDYVLVEQKRVHVEHFRRLEDGGWLLRSYDFLDDVVALDSIGCRVELRELYDGVNVPEGALPMRDESADA